MIVHSEHVHMAKHGHLHQSQSTMVTQLWNAQIKAFAIEKQENANASKITKEELVKEHIVQMIAQDEEFV